MPLKDERAAAMAKLREADAALNRLPDPGSGKKSPEYLTALRRAMQAEATLRNLNL